MVIVRSARKEDFAAVVALTERWASEPSTTGHYVHNTESILRNHLEQVFLVAEEDGCVLGFLLGSLNGNGLASMHYQVLEEGENHLSLDQLYVDPDYRHRVTAGSHLAPTTPLTVFRPVSCSWRHEGRGAAVYRVEAHIGAITERI